MWRNVKRFMDSGANAEMIAEAERTWKERNHTSVSPRTIATAYCESVGWSEGDLADALDRVAELRQE